VISADNVNSDLTEITSFWAEEQSILTRPDSCICRTATKGLFGQTHRSHYANAASWWRSLNLVANRGELRPSVYSSLSRLME
jgi:hypothetical protein